MADARAPLSRHRPHRISSTRRILTLMFADLKGSTSLAQTLDLDAYDTLIRQFHAHSQAVIEGHQGDVVQVYGDGVLSVFGLKVDGEDSALAATHAALSLTGGFAGKFPGQSLRIGLHSGNVMCHRDAAAPELVTGFDVNLTARIQAQARPNGVMASAATHDLLTKIADVEVAARQVTQLRGVRTKTELFEIRSARFRDRKAAQARLVGRDRVLAQLEDVPEDAGRAIIGPGGIGKTAVMDALHRRISQKARVVILRARSNVRRSPLFPFRRWLETAWDDIFVHAKRRLSTLEMAVLENLRNPDETGDLLAPMDAHKLGSLRIVTLGKVVRAYLSGGALMFDDMQWADAQSREVIQHLFQDGTRLPFRVYLFARDAHSFAEICAEPAMDQIALPPLSDHAAMEVLDTASGAPRDAAARSALLKNAAGNPLYLLSLLDRPHTGAGSDVPQSIEASIQSQMDVGGAHLPTLTLAAVLGEVFPHAHLCLFQDDPMEQAHAVEHLVRRGILQLADGILSFCHPLYREVAYEMIPRRARQAKHLRAALAISRKDPAFARAFPELLADHVISAQAWDVIPNFAIAAASHMTKNASHDQALYYIEAANQALAAQSGTAARGSLNEVTVLSLRAAVEIQKYGYAHPQTLHSHHDLERVALDPAGDSFVRMLAFHGTTSHRLISQGVRACRSLLCASAKLAAAGTEVERLLHLGHDCACNLYAGRLDAALVGSEAVRDIYCLQFHSNLFVTIGVDPLASALSVSMQVQALRGDVDGAMADYERGFEHAQSICAHRQLPSLAILGAPALFFGGARRRAFSMLAQGIGLADAQGARMWQRIGRVWHASLGVLSGQMRGQGGRLAKHLRKLDATGVRLSVPLHQSVQAMAEQACGQRRDAGLVIRDALVTCLRRDEVLWLPALLAMHKVCEPGKSAYARHALIEKAFRKRSGGAYFVNVPTVPRLAGMRRNDLWIEAPKETR